ncbi:DUF1266 domain-containing protein [Streptomyces sp. NPDC059169]|uniref:DUF1266 domain-containing protein n=1 Tax=Streptomyces sp. NPDC059169 TaxID=3346754 RepID=UPI0036A1E9A2
MERRLHEAGLRGDRHAQLQVLAAEELFIGQARHEVDAEPDLIRWPAVVDPATGGLCRPLLTRGMLPPWRPDWVFHEVTLAWVADFRWTEAGQWLAVNSGTPAAVHLPASSRDRDVWRRYYAENARSAPKRLSALHTGPLYGPLAFGLACGGHLAVTNGVPWNEVGTVYRAYGTQRRVLREAWGITGHDGWQERVGALLARSDSPPEPEFALRVRTRLVESLGKPPTPELWRETAAATLRDRGAPAPVVKEMEDLVRRITRYEARFRADGLLSDDGRVTSVCAYDYGRAPSVARWGLAARFCTPHQAECAIVRAGALSRTAYRSWEDFSAGYVLGRVLRFDEEEYGRYYDDALSSHRLLVQDEGSPWRHLPWS